MATIQDLFKSRQKQIYGNDNIRIESRGLINPPRGAALLASSPNAIADLIGNQIGGALKGSANRPSDTIFKGKGVFNKPISLFKTQQGLRNAIEPGTDYFIKQSPAPDSILAKLNQGASNLGGVAANLAINAVTSGGLKTLANSLKKKPPVRGNTNKNPYSSEEKNKNRWEYDDITYVDKIEDDKLIETLEAYGIKNQVLVLFRKYGKTTSIPFSGTITGISEDIQPEWTNFRYIGSPFKVNRYQGVERSLKFNLKLYYLTPATKIKMIQKMNYLKSLAFPYDEISEMTYGGDTQKSQYAFSPNLVYLTIGDMYRNVFGFIENLSFSVEENITWPTLGVKDIDNYMYPSVVDVSISLKIIENHKTEKDKGGITRYKYDFDGRGDAYIEEENAGEKKKELNPEPPKEKTEIKKEEKPAEPKKLSKNDIYMAKKYKAKEEGLLPKEGWRPWVNSDEWPQLDAWYPDEAVMKPGETKA